MFRDEAEVEVQAGRGGDGMVAFRREKFVPRGGPAGGDGGDGGSVIFQADPNLTSLVSLTSLPLIKAEAGQHGMGGNKTGRRGADRVMAVPPGTLVYDRDRGNLLKDLDRVGATVVVAQGGKGGKGNARFATSTNRTPRNAEPGTSGERRRLKLELKLIADVGLVGLPNAGKSTLISRLSAARPKVASYPFTTLSPVLGIVELDLDRTFVMADLPGLIEGAHQGQGLGDQFLRHVERTRSLLHLVDCSSGVEDPVHDWRVIREELEAYSPVLAARESVVAATKLDDPAAAEAADRLEEALERPILRLSSVTGRGLDRLLFTLGELLFGA